MSEKGARARAGTREEEGGAYRRRASSGSEGGWEDLSCLWEMRARVRRERVEGGRHVLEGVLEVVDVVLVEGGGERGGDVDRERVDH